MRRTLMHRGGMKPLAATQPVVRRQRVLIPNSRIAKTRHDVGASRGSALSETYVSSTVRLRPSTSAWSDLAGKVRDFSHICFIDELFPDLLTEFIRVERLFDDFTRRAKVVFNNARPTSKTAESRSPVSIEKASEALTAQWHDFITSFLNVLTHNVTPLYSFLTDRLNYLAQMLQGLENLYKEPQPLLAIAPIRKVGNFINSLKLEVVQLTALASDPCAPAFDLAAFADRLRKLDTRVRSMFPDMIPNNSSNIGGMVGTKRELLLACDKVLAITEGIECFDKRSGEATDAILAMDEAFGGLFRALQVPPRPEPADQPATAQPPDDSVFQTASAALENCERIKARISQLEHALDDTSKLFKSKT